MMHAQKQAGQVPCARAYCLNREPEYFKDTLFLVDKASHWGWR
jgi:hypothetical protein